MSKILYCDKLKIIIYDKCTLVFDILLDYNILYHNLNYYCYIGIFVLIFKNVFN